VLARPIARRCLLPAALALILAAFCIAPAAFAGFSQNTINPTATLSGNGHRILVSGPISNTRSEWVDLRVTVTQRSTGAIAEGHLRFAGTTALQQWEVEAERVGSNAFEEGPATAVALAVTNHRGDTDDAHQWLVNVTLVRE